MPDFKWTGPLRPHCISPARPIPNKVKKPDYYFHPEGYPTEEMNSKQQNVGESNPNTTDIDTSMNHKHNSPPCSAYLERQGAKWDTCGLFGRP